MISIYKLIHEGVSLSPQQKNDVVTQKDVYKGLYGGIGARLGVLPALGAAAYMGYNAISGDDNEDPNNMDYQANMTPEQIEDNNRLKETLGRDFAKEKYEEDQKLKRLENIMPKAMAIGALGVPLGYAAGGLIGKSIGARAAKNPNAPADFSKASHRIGHLMRAEVHPMSMVGNFIDPRLTGAIVGGYNAFSQNGARKIGYTGAGSVAAGLLGPWSGFFAPKNINQQKR